MLEQGTLIDGRYQVGRLLGRGGMADVVQADDAATGEAVALKLLREPDLRTEARFRHEIEALEVLDHPSVVRLRGAGHHGVQPYLVLDLVGGPTLAEVLLDGATGFAAALAVAEQLASALAHAHELDVVHRDVKPSNVLFDGFDPAAPRPRLADFGLARFSGSTRVTATGTCVGTAAYLAPEQLEGGGGPPADVYSLGLVLIECLTGALCYPGTVAESALARLHRSPVVPADLPPWLQQTLRAMTSRDADSRPPASAVVASLHDRSADHGRLATVALASAPLDAGPPATAAIDAAPLDADATAPLDAEPADADATAIRPLHRRQRRPVDRTRRWTMAAAGLVLVVGSGAAVAALTGDLKVDGPDQRDAQPAATTSVPPSTGPAATVAVEAARTGPAPTHPPTTPAAPATEAVAPQGNGPSAGGPGAHGHAPKPPDDHKDPKPPKK
jgi:hypothetical protein